MREKLIDLLYGAEGLVNNELPTIEMVADYLISKGVTIPVYCRDCKWWHDLKCTNINGAHCLVMNEYWFCRSGERKNNDA